MKLIRRRCLICLAWYGVRGEMGKHCPFCGAYPQGGKHYSLDFFAVKIREFWSVCHTPLALRHNYYSR